MQTIDAILKETVTLNAIKCEHTTKIETILAKLKKGDLKVITDNHGIKGCSTFNKAKLAERIVEALKDINTLIYILCGFDEKMTSIFMSFVENQIQSIDDVELQYIQQLCQLGYLYPVVEKKKVAIIMPDVVKNVIDDLNPADVEELKTHNDSVYLHMRAFVNLYGVGEINQFIDMYNEATEETITFTHVMDVLRCKGTFLPHVQLFGDLLISDSLLDEHDESLIFDLREHVATKPYYVPTREEVKIYGQGEVDWTPQLLAVKSFMLEQLESDEEKVDHLIKVISEFFSYKYESKFAFMLLEQHNIVLQSFEVSQRFVQLLNDAYAHARLWENRGFTMAEIAPVESDWLESSQQKIVVPTVSPLKSTKVGRNEPCPCGSNKKYKKCCG